MLDILLISDQPRLHTIFAAACDFPDGSFRVATSLAQGLQQAGERTPDLLFLQNRLSGLAGTLLVRHARASSGPATSKIVLLADGSGESEESGADIVLLTNVADSELSDAVAEILGEMLPADPAHPAPRAVPITLETPAIPVEAAVDTVSLSAPTTNLPVGIRPGRAHPSTTGTVVGLPEKEPPLETTILTSSPPPIQWEKKRLIIALSVIAGLAFAAIVLYLAVSRPFVRTQASKPAPPAEAQKAAPPTPEPATPLPVKQPAPLPSFVRTDRPDPAYAAANPGWERYLSETAEYKIFRDNGEIKALQVIDATGAGITRRFFSVAIKEMAGVTDYRLESKEQKGDFLVKKGKLSPAMRIIIYKDKTDKVLNAFVIHLQEQGESLPAPKDKP